MEWVKNRSILLVEDNSELLNQMKNYFQIDNHVVCADTYFKAKQAVESSSFDVAVIDIILPDGDGLEIARLIRYKTPVIILSHLGSEDNIIDGLDAGAADYIVKPCSMTLLERKIALRLLPPEKSLLCKRGISLDTRNRTVYYKDTPVYLTSSEFNLLLFLMQNEGKFFSANVIYEEIWQAPSLNTGTIKVHLHNLRKKLSDISPECGHLIATRFGKGYSFGGKNENLY